MLVFPAVQHFNTKCWRWWQGQSIKPGKKHFGFLILTQGVPKIVVIVDSSAPSIVL